MSDETNTLIQRTCHGDEVAFTTLIRRYQGMVFATAYHYVKDFQDAQEIVQDVFMKVFRRLDTLKDHRRFAGWLNRIASNESMRFLRARTGRPITRPLQVGSREVVLLDMQQYADAQVRTSVAEILKSLPEDRRLLIELRYLGGCTSGEIAELMGKKPGTVRYQLHRTIQSLKETFAMVEDKFQSEQLPHDFAEQVLLSLGRLKGKVIGIDGAPYGNIILHLDQLLSGRGGGYSSRGIYVDADGTFSVDIPNWGRIHENEVASGEFHIHLYGWVDGAVRHAHTCVTLKIGEQADDVILDLREEPHPLQVCVTDPDDRPVEGARVAFHIRYPGGSGHGFLDTYDGKDLSCFLTDAEGLTPMLHLTDFSYSFEVTASHFKKMRSHDGRRIKIPEEIPENGILTIPLEPGGRIAGRVLDSEAVPVADADVVLRTYKSGRDSWNAGRYIDLRYTFPGDVMTDAEGRFAFTTLETEGAYSLHAYHRDHGVDCLLDAPVGTDDAELHLMPVVTLHGEIYKDAQPVVILEKDRDPVGNRIEIDFVESPGTYTRFNDLRMRPFDSCKIRIDTDDAGVFRIDALFPGATYKLTIHHEGEAYVRRVTLGEEAEQRMTFTLD